jgi:alcohol dehydrogenase
MLGGDDLALPYHWLMRNNITLRGQWMFPREAVPRLIALARAGLLDLGGFRVTPFPLDRANEALEHAARTGGRFRMTLLCP